LVFDEVDLRVKLFGWSFPATVEISTYQRTAVVSMNHAVRVDHREDLEDEGISQRHCLGFLRDQKFDEVVHDPA
jgi:hypothetical protein